MTIEIDLRAAPSGLNEQNENFFDYFSLFASVSVYTTFLYSWRMKISVWQKLIGFFSFGSIELNFFCQQFKWDCVGGEINGFFLPLTCTARSPDFMAELWKKSFPNATLIFSISLRLSSHSSMWGREDSLRWLRESSLIWANVSQLKRFISLTSEQM